MAANIELLEQQKRGHKTGDDYTLKTYIFQTTKDFLFVYVRNSDNTVVEVTASPSTLATEALPKTTEERIAALKDLLGITPTMTVWTLKSGHAIIIRPKGLSITATKLP